MGCFQHIIFLSSDEDDGLEFIMQELKNKKAAVAQMKTICDNNTLKQKKVTNSCETINDDIKTWTGNLTTVVDSITTAFGDSIYAINATN